MNNEIQIFTRVLSARVPVLNLARRDQESLQPNGVYERFIPVPITRVTRPICLDATGKYIRSLRVRCLQRT